MCKKNYWILGLHQTRHYSFDEAVKYASNFDLIELFGNFANCS